MDLKKIIQEIQSHPKISEYRYESAKVAFVGMSVVFFLNYMLIGTNFLSEESVFLLTYTYAGFLTTFGFFISLYLQKTFPSLASKSLIVNVGILLFCLILFFPFL